jgi:hypothetical protein
MDILEAEAELKKPVPDAKVYDLILRVTGSEEKAAAAMSERIAYRLRREEKFEG